jgi:hypothetical protein
VGAGAAPPAENLSRAASASMAVAASSTSASCAVLAAPAAMYLRVGVRVRDTMSATG